MEMLSGVGRAYLTALLYRSLRSFNCIPSRIRERRSSVISCAIYRLSSDFRSPRLCYTVDRRGERYYSNFYFHTAYPIGKNSHGGRGLTFAVLNNTPNTLGDPKCSRFVDPIPLPLLPSHPPTTSRLSFPIVLLIQALPPPPPPSEIGCNLEDCTRC